MPRRRGLLQASPAESFDVLASVGTRSIRVADVEAEAARRAALGQTIPAKEALLEDTRHPGGNAGARPGIGAG